MYSFKICGDYCIFSFQPWMVLVRDSTMTRVDKQKKRKLIADYSDDQFIVEIIYQSEMSNVC